MLKGSWGVTHAEEHNFWFKEPSSDLKGSFPLVTVTNSNIVISPSDIKFAEELHFLEVFNALHANQTFLLKKR
jgi:hypothetical protein